MNTLLHRFKININKLLPAKQGRILLAVSGGIDSMVMVDLFQRNQISFGIAHCNFQLRGEESDKDEQLVESLAKKLNVSFFKKRFETEVFASKESLSIQMAARALRYEWFTLLCNQHHFDLIATAHHADDNAETMLLNFIRGKGLTAIAGIPKKKEHIIRPLLFSSREHIKNYAIENNLEWREDQSNLSTDYDRNFLRLKVIPLLKELNPSLEKSLLQSSVFLKESAAQIESEYRKWKSGNIIGDGEKTSILNLGQLNQHLLKSNFLFLLLKEFNFAPAIIRQVVKNLTAIPGTVYLSTTHRLLFDRNTISLLKNNEPPQKSIFSIPYGTESFCTGDATLHFSLTTPSPEIFKNTNPEVTFVNADELIYPLTMRHWEDGDAFCPLGMKQHKKLSDFFIDEKVSNTDKANIWLLTSNDKIVWIAGLRIDDRFKVTPATKTVLKITFAS